MRKAFFALVLVVLIAFAGYSIYVLVIASIVKHGKGADPGIFWPSIAVICALTWVALFLANRIRRRHFANVS